MTPHLSFAGATAPKRVATATGQNKLLPGIPWYTPCRNKDNPCVYGDCWCEP